MCTNRFQNAVPVRMQSVAGLEEDQFLLPVLAGSLQANVSKTQCFTLNTADFFLFICYIEVSIPTPIHYKVCFKPHTPSEFWICHIGLGHHAAPFSVP
jgi:hypothetical protein